MACVQAKGVDVEGGRIIQLKRYLCWTCLFVCTVVLLSLAAAATILRIIRDHSGNDPQLAEPIQMPPKTCSTTYWGDCEPAPGTGTCLDHVEYAMRNESMSCHQALDETKHQCPMCGVCRPSDCISTCAKTPWGDCDSNPNTGSCMSHLSWAITQEGKSCTEALAEIHSTCPACSWCGTADCVNRTFPSARNLAHLAQQISKDDLLDYTLELLNDSLINADSAVHDAFFTNETLYPDTSARFHSVPWPAADVEQLQMFAVLYMSWVVSHDVTPVPPLVEGPEYKIADAITGDPHSLIFGSSTQPGWFRANTFTIGRTIHWNYLYKRGAFDTFGTSELLDWMSINGEFFLESCSFDKSLALAPKTIMFLMHALDNGGETFQEALRQWKTVDCPERCGHLFHEVVEGWDSFNVFSGNGGAEIFFDRSGVRPGVGYSLASAAAGAGDDIIVQEQVDCKCCNPVTSQCSTNLKCPRMFIATDLFQWLDSEAGPAKYWVRSTTYVDNGAPYGNPDGYGWPYVCYCGKQGDCGGG